MGHIVVNNASGLVIAGGVASAASVDIGQSLNADFANVASGAGTLSGTVTRLTGGANSYVAGVAGTGTLVLSGQQVLNGATVATVDRGVVVYGGSAQLNSPTTKLIEGSSTATTSAVNLSIADAAQIVVSSLTLGGTNTSAQAITFNMNGGSLTAGTINLFGGATASAVVANFNGGVATIGSLTKTGTPTSLALNLNGGVLQASANSSSFLGGVNATIGTNGAKFDTQANNVTIGSTLTGTTGGLTKSRVGTLTLAGPPS